METSCTYVLATQIDRLTEGSGDYSVAAARTEKVDVKVDLRIQSQFTYDRVSQQL